MDKKQAQFILHSFRPDGADAANADFAEALQLAAEDRELGEWLADERAADSEFAEALTEVEIPDELRMHILTVMRGEKPSDPALEAEMDAILYDAVNTVSPPDGLRDQILAAMQVQVDQGQAEEVITVQELPGNIERMPETTIESPSNQNLVNSSAPSSKIHWLRRSSLAAALALGAFFAFQIEMDQNGTDAQTANLGNSSRSLEKISSHDVQQVAGKILNSKFAFDVMNPVPTQVNSWLSNHELPVPSHLPEGLQGMKVMGCKEIKLAGNVSASLLCFIKESGGMVHLVVIDNKFIKDANLPSMDEMKKGDCYYCPETGWNVVRWRDRDNTFLLLAKKETATQDDLMMYF